MYWHFLPLIFFLFFNLFSISFIVNNTFSSKNDWFTGSKIGKSQIKKFELRIYKKKLLSFRSKIEMLSSARNLYSSAWLGSARPGSARLRKIQLEPITKLLSFPQLKKLFWNGTNLLFMKYALHRFQYLDLESFCHKKSPKQEIGLGRFWE